MKTMRCLTALMALALVASVLLGAAAVPTRPTNNAVPKIGLLESFQGISTTSNITVLPSYNFTLGGHVYTGSNTPVSNGTLKVVAFDSVFYAKTGTNGSFQVILNVPPNTANGFYEVSVAFDANGQYGPSSNFTSVKVARSPLNFTISIPSIVVSGSSGTISGSVKSNGSALAGCAVSVTLPWDVYYGKTDASGNYQISVSVPLAQLSPVAHAVISANPVQPYIETVQTTRSIGLFNPVELIFPVIVVGAVLYEMRSLDLLSKKEIRASIDLLGAKLDSVTRSMRLPGTAQKKLRKEGRSSKIVQIYADASSLASARFQIRLLEGLTIRQITDRISKLDSEGKGAKLFSQISHIMEDYLYSRTFDESRVKYADAFLAQLKLIWGGKETEQGKK